MGLKSRPFEQCKPGLFCPVGAPQKVRTVMKALGLTLAACGALCPFGLKKDYQTLQTFAGGFVINWPTAQEKARANSGIFTTTPLMRYTAGE